MDIFIKRLLGLLLYIGIYFEIHAQVITVKNPEFAFKGIKLAYHYADGIYFLKKTTLNESGFGLIHNDSLETGLYYIFYNDTTFTEFVYDAEDPGKITIDHNRETDITEINGPNTTMLYNTFIKKTDKLFITQPIIKETVPEKKRKKTFSPSKGSLFSLTNQADSLINLIISQTQSTFLKAYLKAKQSITIPEYSPPENIINKDSAIWNFQLTYYKKHYLDNIDLSNAYLIHTPVYTEKINLYLDQITSKDPGELSNAVDYLIQKASPDSAAHHFLLAYLLNKYEENKNNAIDEYIYLYIIEKYYLQSGYRWITNKDLGILSREYTKRKPSSLGEIAPEIELPDTTGLNINLYDIKGDWILLYFMSYECPLCNKVTPEVKKLANRYNYIDLKVLTVCVGNNKKLWEKYINNKKISNWINLFGGEQMSKTAIDYNLRYTPTLLLLNGEKRIEHKNLNVKQLEDILLQIAIEKHQ